MSDFVSFARACGIIIDAPPPVGYWRRYPTIDHPRKRNGAVKWMGDHGFVQNWATDQSVAVWRDENSAVDQDRMRRMAHDAEKRKAVAQEAAARKAGWILKSCVLSTHEYLKKKGFPDEVGNVWANDGAKLLVIPMRINGKVVGAQLIDEAGGKKFLLGQRTSEAQYVIDNKGQHILVEGYATALSVRAALAAFKRRYTIHVCFSAGNLVKVSRHLPKGFVIADNDASGTGETAAKETCWPYFMPPTVGQDFNDYHAATGLFKVASALNRAMFSAGVPSR